MKPLRLVRIALVVGIPSLALASQNEKPGVLSSEQVIERVSPCIVLILVGKGDGQTTSIGSGLIVRPDGAILTANHLVKGISEVQVRLKNGEVYDKVELAASDDRRDIACLRIPAAGLPTLAVSSSGSIAAGAPVFAVSNRAGLPSIASPGILSAQRMADELPSAGSGYRVLQFTAPLTPGSSSGVLVDAEARALGLIVGSATAGQNVTFAVPLDSVVGLASATRGTAFSSGEKLQMQPQTALVTPPTVPRTIPETRSTQTSAPDPDQLQIRSLSISSKTIYLRRERLQDELRNTATFKRMGLRFADYGETADVSITIDRPALTFEWTYAVLYQPSGSTLALGLIEAEDEYTAGPALAARIVEHLAAAAARPRASLKSSSRVRNALGSCSTIFVESHTIWMKGNLLQDALYVRPELREWGIKIVDNRDTADIYIDVTRPFLTYDWVYQIIDRQTGAEIGRGKVVAIDGNAAALRLSQEIVKLIQAVRPISVPPQP